MDPHSAMSAYGLKFNPFPPAATGVAFSSDLWLPQAWSSNLDEKVAQLTVGAGEKAMTVVGAYGSGKTYVLHWLMQKQFMTRRIRPYFFDNPGTTLYDLANQLLRQVGRQEFTKVIWELSYKPDHSEMPAPRLFDITFPQWLSQNRNASKRQLEIGSIAGSLLESKLVDEEEIAYRFAQLTVDTGDRPYYEFRDFIPRSSSSYVAEGEEARYFKALTKILKATYDAQGIAFFLDEFEDISLGKRLARRQASEYVATLKRLLDAAREEDLWLVLSITPEGLEQTRRLEPPLMQRFSTNFAIPQLTAEEAYQLVRHRLDQARYDHRDDIWPLEEECLSALDPSDRGIPRRLIRVLWRTLALASQQGINPPIPAKTVSEAERLLRDEL